MGQFLRSVFASFFAHRKTVFIILCNLWISFVLTKKNTIFDEGSLRVHVFGKRMTTMDYSMKRLKRRFNVLMDCGNNHDEVLWKFCMRFKKDCIWGSRFTHFTFINTYINNVDWWKFNNLTKSLNNICCQSRDLKANTKINSYAKEIPSFP